MRGEILHYDEEQGFGFLTGADGNRYSFAREDMRRETSLAKGASVEFQPSGGQARNVYSVRPQASAASAGATAPAAAAPQAVVRQAATQQFGRAADTAPARSTGLWDYFWRAVTQNYFNFVDRARRKEFWGFCLFWTISIIAVVAIGLAADAAIGDLEPGQEMPAMTVGLSGLFILATIPPWIGLIVRRLHDIGLTGWLAILCFIPTVGGLATLVFALIPTQGRENQWGPVPAGVRI
ncbi:DUF805 domain-containing protein [Mesorhizobium sp. 131-2-1]|uniref:DUF805 domain-containing protein n=1 Tax=Mesorhizobium sp. 131-2-1 TaxID=2744518 RepID=UPI0019268219|nr:DUF805 domain-containing protein [Mesorhizobium sp. 131-2-1]BCG92023.1 hypothetical protein MesoLj131a_08870 [Mesorhizobium sp. 131-2-1]